MTRRRFLATGGLPIVGGGGGTPPVLVERMAGRGFLEMRPDVSAITAGATGYGRRYRIDLTHPVSQITLRWEGRTSGTYSGAPMLAAAIEGGPAVLFSGVDEAAYPIAGASLTSDPITLPAPATHVWVRVWFANATGTTMPQSQGATRATLGEAFTTATMSKATVLGGAGVTAGWSAAGNTTAFARPGALFAQIPDTLPSVITLGDSIGTGNSYLPRACALAGVAARNSSYGGMGAPGFLAGFTTNNPGGLGGYTLAVVQLGINSAAPESLISIWDRIEDEGVPAIWQCTITPGASSTDGHATVANQTPLWFSPSIVIANTWLRDGAPLTAARAYAPAGTSDPGTLRVGDVGHYLTRVVDVAAVVQDPDDERLWRAPTSSTPTVGGTYGGDGVHPTTYAHDAMAAVLAAALTSP